MPLLGKSCASALLVISLLIPLHSWAAQKPLILGVFPYLNSYLVVSKFAPMRDYLASQLGRPVQVYTATDFRTFIERTQKGEYDIVLTAPHLARMAILEGNYVPLSTYKAQLSGMIIVNQNSSFMQLSDLRGKSLAIPDKLALVTMLGKQVLQDAGLQADKDYKMVVTRSHSSAALSVRHHQQDAAIIGSNPYKQLPPEDQAQLRILAQTPAFPAQYYIAHKRLGTHQLKQIQAALVQFANSTQAGQNFIAENKLEGILNSDGEELKKLDPFVIEVKTLQKQQQL